MKTDWDSKFLTYCVEMHDKMLRQLNDNVMKRGDTRKNYEEIKACEIFRMICKKAL